MTDRKQSPEKPICDWQSAFRTANKRATAPYVSYAGGWFRIKGRGGAVRMSTMIELTRSLNERISAKDLKP